MHQGTCRPNRPARPRRRGAQTVRRGAPHRVHRSGAGTPRRETRMRAIIEAIERHSAERGYPPTVRELMTATGLSSTSVVAYWLDACAREGLVVREPLLSRAVGLTEAGRALAASPLDAPSRTAAHQE